MHFKKEEIPRGISFFCFEAVTRKIAVFEFLRVGLRSGVTRIIAVFTFLRVGLRSGVTRRIAVFEFLRVRGLFEVTRIIAVFAFLLVSAPSRAPNPAHLEPHTPTTIHPTKNSHPIVAHFAPINTSKVRSVGLCIVQYF